MIEKIKQTKSEKILIIFLIILFLTTFLSFFLIKNKCLFIKSVDPAKLNFSKPENIAILNVSCGNVIIELFPDLSPNSVERFKMLINNNEYDSVAFHRVLKDVLVQAGDLKFGKRENINYTFLGTGESGYGQINSEINQSFEFEKGTVAFARKDKFNTEDSQFFILLQDAPIFKGEYTPLGKVIYGLNILEKVKFDEKTEYVLRPDFINYFKMLVE